MKRLFPFVLLLMFLIAGCEQMSADIEDLKSRIAALEGTTIASINQQVSSIQSSLGNLESADKSLQGYIDALQGKADALKENADAVPGLKDAVSALETAVGALKDKDADLIESIASLSAYADSLKEAQQGLDQKLTQQEAWISATFATLDQYRETVGEVAALKGEVQSVNAALNSQIDSVANETAALASELKKLNSDWEAKISETESNLKNWVNEALSGYYDIAAIDAKLAALASSSQSDQDSVKAEVQVLAEKLEKAKEELTAAYKKAISDAIDGNGGVISEKMASAINDAETRIMAEVNSLKETVEGIEKRLATLEAMVGGLRVSNAVFGFVTYMNQTDTITKGLKYPFLFRVNPSGVKFTQDMVVLDNMSNKKFLRVTTKASYVTPSTNFVVDTLARTRNASNQEQEGQYQLFLKTTETRNMIDDNTFSLVGAYRDNESKVQYVSSNPFGLVMMPTPAEGLDAWGYLRGQVTHAELVSTPDPNDADKTIDAWKETIGEICYSFDRTLYRNEKDDSDTRNYSVDNLRSFQWEGDTAADSIVIFEPVRDSAFVRFLPDTSRIEWGALLDTTQLSSLTVSGKIIAFDRYGGSSEFPVKMIWYSRFADTLTFNMNVSDFWKDNGDGTESRVRPELDIKKELEDRGYVFSDIQASVRKQEFGGAGTPSSSRFMFAFNSGDYSKVVISSYAPKTAMAGTHYGFINMKLSIYPSEKYPLVSYPAIDRTIIIRLVVAP